MGTDKKGSKSGGGYVGGFLQLFDWNAKSRKKLFSSKTDLPDQSKQKKRCDGNLPKTRVHLMDEDEIVAGSSIKGSSDYSCASSVTDDDIYGTRAPGVVARLMGLDSLPTNHFSEPFSTPFSDSQSLRDFRHHSGHLESRHDQIMFSGALHDKIDTPVWNMIETTTQKLTNRRIEKFQTEVLPPKSAKSIPITHHKLLSPIKSSKFIPSKDAAHIMEAAARIIEPGPQVTVKARVPTVASSSVPLKVKDLKEKAEASQRPFKLAEACRRPGESSTSKFLKGQSINKSWNGSTDTTMNRSCNGSEDTTSRVSSDSEECLAGTRNKGKSISLALQAKANVQKREGLNWSSSRNVIGQKEPSEVTSGQSLKSQPSTQKNTQKKFSVQVAPSVLQQNNQKQNCLADMGKLPMNPSVPKAQGRKGNGDSSFTRQKSSNKTIGNCKVGSRRLGSDLTNDKKEGSGSSAKNVTRKKRCIEGDIQFEKKSAANNISSGKSGKLIQSGSLMDKQISWPAKSKRNATDIVSFTFTAPMTRSISCTQTSREVEDFPENYRGKRVLLSPDGLNTSKLSSFGKSVLGSDALSTLLEQKLKELTHAVEVSQQKAGKAGVSALNFPLPMSGIDASMTSNTLRSNLSQDVMHTENPFGQLSSKVPSTDFKGLLMKHTSSEMGDEMDNYESNENAAKKLHGLQFPSPISVLESSFLAESCNSSDRADSISTGGSKLCSSVQAQDMPRVSSLKRLHPFEADVELLDSASSTNINTLAQKNVITSSIVSLGQSTTWELKYVKEILCDVELMFKNFAMGRAHHVINPGLFDHLECKKGLSQTHDHESKLRRQVLFDCVSECLDIRCKQYASGGCRAWAKGLSLARQKERLAEEVYNEISGWAAMGNYMVDELVDKDMSSQHGRWLDFECEAFELGLQIENRLLNSLLDEVVADLLVL